MTGGAVPVLEVGDLRVTYPGTTPVRALDGLSLSVPAGRTLGILGESGSGKSTLALALLGLLDGATVAGTLRLGDLDLGALSQEEWRAVRWRRIAVAFQSTSSLNPVLRIGTQLAEPLRFHLGLGEREAEARGAGLLGELGLGPDALSRYPRQLSGGQRRLVLLALALTCDPEVLILDEPTSGLDPVTRQRVLAVLARIRAEGTTAMVMLGHDVEAVDEATDTLAVLYRGWLAEIGPSGAVLADPRSPYAWGLLNARPTLASVKELRGIRGDPPNPGDADAGCPFLDRCTQPVAACAPARPPLVVPDGAADDRRVACVRGGLVTLLSARGLRKVFRVPGSEGGRVAAVDGIDLDVREGESVGLVGATGAGKSTLASLLVRQLVPDEGTVTFAGHDLATAGGSVRMAARRRIQMLFQDPFEAMSGRLTIGESVREPLDIQQLGGDEDRDTAVRRVLAAVRLPSDDAFLGRYTHALSGGQLQRVALARALVLEPKLLIADEPISMLDPSEQAKILQLLKQLQVERGMAMIFVTHDLAVVLRVVDRVVVVHEGRVVEEGLGTDLLVTPRHEVTRRLLTASGRDTLFERAWANRQ